MGYAGVFRAVEGFSQGKRLYCKDNTTEMNTRLDDAKFTYSIKKTQEVSST